jgi:hypothetical protein
MAKAEIYYDDQHRRRVDRSVGPAPPTQEQRSEARLVALQKELAELKSTVAGMTITGTGFSGSGPNGIQYNDPDGGATSSTGGANIAAVSWVVVDPSTSTVDLYIDGTATGTLGTKLT